MNNSVQVGGSTDLLSSIMGVTVRNEEKISAEDRGFCQSRQEKLHASLSQLQWWYGLFTANAERYRESYNLTYAENGSIDTGRLRRIYQSVDREDYKTFEFLPFDVIDDVVKLYGKAVEAFGRDIIRHFNSKYGVSVPAPDFDDEKLPMGFMPKYQTYVDLVVEHLGGKGFRDTAEEELIARFHKVVVPGPYSKFKVELKGNRIVFPDMLWYEDYSWQTALHLHYNSTDSLNTLCAGIIFGATGALNGNMDFIAGYDRRDVNVSQWYGLNIDEDVSVKFFKNHRVDFHFGNADAAERCWRKLRLDTFVIAIEHS